MSIAFHGSLVLAWIAASALVIAWGLTPQISRRRKWFLGAGLLLAFLALTTTVLSAGLVFIEPVDRGVVISVLDEGVRSEALQPGLNWVVPYLESVVTYPISRQPYAMMLVPREGPHIEDDLVQVETAEGDKRYVGAIVIYSIGPDRVIEIHIKWQGQYEENLVRPVARGVIRDIFQLHDTAEIGSDRAKLIEEQIQDEAESLLHQGGLLLIEFKLTEVLTEQEYSALLEQRRNEEPEEKEDTSRDRGVSVEGFRSDLQTVACLTFPVMILVAVVLSVRRKAIESEPSLTATRYQVSDAAQAIGMETSKASSPEEYYILGKALLERGERSQAIEAFTEAYRASEDLILKREALKQLEGLDAAKRL